MISQSDNNENVQNEREKITIRANEKSKRVLSLWISVVTLILVFMTAVLAGLITSWILIITAILAVAGILAALMLPKYFCDEYLLKFDGVSVRANMGVIYKKNIFIPVSAFRTFELVVTPIQAAFKCRTVIIRYAGGAALFPALPKEKAEEFINILKKIEFDR